MVFLPKPWPIYEKNILQIPIDRHSIKQLANNTQNKKT